MNIILPLSLIGNDQGSGPGADADSGVEGGDGGAVGPADGPGALKVGKLRPNVYFRYRACHNEWQQAIVLKREVHKMRNCFTLPDILIMFVVKRKMNGHHAPNCSTVWLPNGGHMVCLFRE